MVLILYRWKAIFHMAKEYKRNGRSLHDVPSPETMDALNIKSPSERLILILGQELVDEFQQAFEKADTEGEGELDTYQI